MDLSPQFCLFHEFEIDPNGNYAMQQSASGDRLRSPFSRRMQPSTQSFLARSIILNSIPGLATLNGTALIGKTPEKSRRTPELGEQVWLDGYPVRITPQSKLFPAPGSTLFLPILNTDGTLETGNVIQKPMTVSATEAPAALKLKENTSEFNSAKRIVVGNITATHLRFWPNRVDVKNEVHDEKLVLAINAHSYMRHTSGAAKFQHEEEAILPHTMTQEDV